MNPFDSKDTILDAFLDEVLSGQTPPDNASQILSALKAGTNGSSNGNGRAVVPPPVAPPVQRVESAVEESLVQVALRSDRRQRREQQWSGLAIIACLLFLGVAVGLIALTLSDSSNNDPEIVESNDPNDNANESPSDENDTDPPRPDSNLKKPKDNSRIVQKENDFNSIEPFKIPGEDQPKYDPSIRKDRPDPSPDSEVIAFINETIKVEWSRHNIESVDQAEDEEWCRRVYVRLVGRIPSVDELKQFVASNVDGKRTELVDELLASEEYIKHSTTVWTNVLIGRYAGRDRGDLANREELEAYVRSSFEEEKPYDQMAFELLTATGSDGAANFMLAGAKDHAKTATAHVSRVFLGNNLRCVECHDHYASGITQQKFWQLNAFFQQMQIRGDAVVNRDAKDSEAFYSDANGVLKAALPVLPDGTPIPDDGSVSEVDRRAELASWLVSSDQLSRATVNRVWARFFRFGFTPRVDDMGSHNPPSHPELLDRLSTEFVAHNYDLQSLTRWIALSDVFGLSSKMPDGDLVDAPELGKQPLFSRYYMRPMQREEVYNSLLAISKKGGSTKPADFFNAFVTKKPGDTVDPHISVDDPDDGTFSHGPLKQNFLSEEHVNLLGRVAKSTMSDEEKIEHLFLTALSREPRKNELELANKLYEANKDDTYAVLEIVWWAILNSNEFVLDH